MGKELSLTEQLCYNTTRIESMEGNLCSLALSINYNGLKALIGGDMEVGRMKQDKYNYSICESDCPKHEDCGWCDAIADGNVFACEKPYHFINLPHHSSASAYCPKMWKEGMDEGGPIVDVRLFLSQIVTAMMKRL